MKPTLDYRTPDQSIRRLNVRAAAIAGVSAGAVTFGSGFLVGPFFQLGVGLLAGIIMSAMAARASKGFEFSAGFVASGFAAASVPVTSIFCAPWLDTGVVQIEPTAISIILGSLWVLFAVPGMLGSLSMWEGRRPREWDNLPPAG